MLLGLFLFIIVTEDNICENACHVWYNADIWRIFPVPFQTIRIYSWAIAIQHPYLQANHMFQSNFYLHNSKQSDQCRKLEALPYSAQTTILFMFCECFFSPLGCNWNFKSSLSSFWCENRLQHFVFNKIY